MYDSWKGMTENQKIKKAMEKENSKVLFIDFNTGTGWHIMQLATGGGVSQNM